MRQHDAEEQAGGSGRQQGAAEHIRTPLETSRRQHEEAGGSSRRQEEAVGGSRQKQAEQSAAGSSR